MNRIRTVKPELFRHLALFEAEEKYQLPLRVAFIGLFTCCDREGRFLWQPRRLKVDILPYDDTDISEVLNALIESGFIRAYEVDGIVYGCIPTWIKHQYINNKEADSELPDITAGKRLKPPVTQSVLAIHAKLSEASSTYSARESYAYRTHEDRAIHEPGNETSTDARVMDACVTREAREPHKGRERKGREQGKEQEREKEGSGEEKPKHRPPPEAAAQIIFAHWQRTMQHPNAVLDKSRRRWIREAFSMGYDAAALCQAIDGCACTPHNIGQNERGERYDGLHVILKSADQIDRFIRNAKFPPRPQGKSEQRLQKNIYAAETWLNQNSAHPMEN